MDRYDLDDNGVIEFDDTSIAFRRYAFYRFDSNRDRKLTRDEIEAATRERLKNYR